MDFAQLLIPTTVMVEKQVVTEQMEILQQVMIHMVEKLEQFVKLPQVTILMIVTEEKQVQ